MARRIVLVLTVALVLVAPGRWAIGAPVVQPAATPAGQATPVAGEGAPLDLAWLALAPADVPGGGYGWWTGSHQTLEGYARGLSTQEEAQRSFAEAAAAAGWRRAYDGWLALPSEEDPDNRARSVRTTLAQYATPAGALSGYRLLAEELARMGYERAGTAPGVGRESGVHRYAGTDQRTGARYQEVRLLARSGSVAAAVSILDYENAAPAISEVMELAKTVVARIERVAGGEAPGMSLQVPRLRPEGVVPREDVYRRRNGEEVPSYRQDPAWLRSTDERNDRDRITDRYAYSAEWRPPAAPGAEPVTYAAVVHRFDDEAAAESYAATAPQAFVDNRLPPTRRGELVAGATGTMSGVVAFASDRETGIASGYIGWVRAGDRVASVALSAVPEVPREAHDELMRQMAACLAARSCLDPVPLPGNVGTVPGPGATPVASPVATPVASPQGSLAATGACAVGAAPVATEAEASMDLAWAMPGPDAFGPDAGLSRSRFPTLRDYAGTFPSTGPGQPMLIRALENAGWRAAAAQTIAVPSVEDPEMFARSLEIGVAEFASADCASWALTAIADTLVAANHQRARSAPAVGEEAVALRRGATSSSGRPYEVLRLLVRSGAAVVDVAVLDWTDNAPPLSEAAALAETITERIPQARGAEAPRLGLRVPRLGAPGTVSSTDWYWRRNGEQLRTYNRDPASLRADDDLNDGLAVTDGYAYYADWTDPNRPSAEPVGYQVSVLRFASDAAATTWLEQAPERFAASPGFLFAEPIDDVGAVGDGSAVVEYALERRSGGTVRGYRGWVRVGNLVTTMALSAAPDVPRGAFAELLRTTADCLSAACPERIALPAGLAGRLPAGSPASTAGGRQAAGEATVTIEAVDIGWRYDGERTVAGKSIVVPVAPGATIALPNLGLSPHNFTIEKLGISVDISPGMTALATIPAGTPPGDYEFYCNIPGHKPAGMVGILRVQSGAATPVPDAPATPGTPTAPAIGTPATPAAPTLAASAAGAPTGTPAVTTNVRPRTFAGLAGLEDGAVRVLALQHPGGGTLAANFVAGRFADEAAARAALASVAARYEPGSTHGVGFTAADLPRLGDEQVAFRGTELTPAGDHMTAQGIVVVRRGEVLLYAAGFDSPNGGAPLPVLAEALARTANREPGGAATTVGTGGIRSGGLWDVLPRPEDLPPGFEFLYEERPEPLPPLPRPARTQTAGAPAARTPTPTTAAVESPTAFPPGLAPADCLVALRPGTERDWLALLSGPAPASVFATMGWVLDEAPPLPPGAPADAATQAAIARTASELAACLNAGDHGRVTALYSDGYWRRILPQLLVRSGMAAEQLAENLAIRSTAGQRLVRPGQRVVSVAVVESRLLPDGRVGAVVTLARERGEPYHGFLIFARVGGRWLIDDRVLFRPGDTPAATPAAATPVAAARRLARRAGSRTVGNRAPFRLVSRGARRLPSVIRVGEPVSDRVRSRRGRHRTGLAGRGGRPWTGGAGWRG